MESATVARFMELVLPLSTEDKLEILAKLSESLKADFQIGKDNKDRLLDDLAGTWSDLEDELAHEIISSRYGSDRDITL